MNIITFPGLIDMHVHLRDPGQTKKEDFQSASQAALAGGFVQIFDMPNNVEPITTLDRLDNKIKLSKKVKNGCRIGFYFGTDGNNIKQFDLVKNKVVGLKLYLNPTTGNLLVNTNKLENIYRAWSGGVILVHAEDEKIESIIDVVKKTHKPTHICHVSTIVELCSIIRAKERGLPITCGVTPHHLFLTQDDLHELGPFGLMKPELKTKKDQEFLWENMAYIDTFESDHAPHLREEKESISPPFGVPGLETTLPLLLTAMNEGRLTISDIIDRCYTNPKKILQLDTDDEAKVLVDVKEEYEIRNENLKTKCGWSPFHGWKVKGKVRGVFVGGKSVQL